MKVNMCLALVNRILRTKLIISKSQFRLLKKFQIKRENFDLVLVI